MPAPNNTNFERLYVAKIPRGSERQVQLALDAALKRRADDRHERHGDDEERADLRENLVDIINRHMDGDGAVEAIKAIDEHFGSPTYGGSHRRGDDEEPDDEGRERMREYLRDKDVDDGIIDDLVESMPHSGMHGLGGRVHETDDRRRTARDRRMAQDAAAERTFNEMFGADRIKQAL
jgi:hypothetical protein